MSVPGLQGFRRFFGAIHRDSAGNPLAPFPWQERLMERVLVSKQPWPEVLTLPTASGKTACLDIALFALAAQADRPAQERNAPRRICFVVDRRIIVDEAFRRARKMAKALRESNDAAVVEVAQRLRQIGGDADADPISVFQLRGGLYRDHTWARTPAQPTIICSTVDQLGSRLLFRGYGVRDLTRPIHAGLIGNDTLIFLDEAHVAEPFLETVTAFQHYRRHAKQPLTLPFHFVVMSATPPDVCRDRFPASAKEMKPDLDHNIFGPRGKASKPALLTVAANATGKNFIKPMAEIMAAQAESLASQDRRVIAVLANRVATARAVRECLARGHGSRVMLFTGRMRPVDRDAELDRAEREFRLSTSVAGQRKLDQPVFIVATQCLEVGADMDFDALVTECASFDALRQRFGRLNRGGRKMADGKFLPARGVIVIRGDQTDASDDDPVYGPALAATWKWLKKKSSKGEVDFGIEAVRKATKDIEPKLLAQLRVSPTHAPVMLPAHLDCWVQTSPEPCPSPDVSLFLHGPQRGEPEVYLCWRADLPDSTSQQAATAWSDTLALCPPAVAECLSVPLWRVRQWLRSGDPQLSSLADADGRAVEPEDQEEPRPPLRAYCWRGQEDSVFVRSPEDLWPGDTVVLLAPEGSVDWLGTAPDHAAALDAGDRVQLTARARPVLRLHPALISTWPESEGKRRLLALATSADLADRLSDDEANLRDEFVSALESLAAGTTDPKYNWLRDTARAFVKELGDRQRFRRVLKPHPAGDGLILRAVRRYRRAVDEDEIFPEGGDASSSAARAVTLTAHSEAVAARARQFAQACGLGDSLAGDLVLAARLHDIGKADPRFQAMLRGLPVRAVSKNTTPLAKSDRTALTRTERDVDRRRAGYPPGGRHELLSVRLAESAPSLLKRAHDADLVLHLIAGHHGHCRPFAPVVDDANPVEVSVSIDGFTLRHSSATGLEHLTAGVADRFWRLVRRYGWWGLAYLETMLRLTDHRQSEIEQLADP
ncbi:MAG: type I-U CRISPR-associated helicase/endonuclease Cas3 [Verrucomicrobiia bacterium]